MKIAFTIVFAFLTAFISSAQEKKEKQIKVIVTDKDGKEVVIDTTYSGKSHLETVDIGDVKVFIIGKDGSDIGTAHVTAGESGKVVVIKSDSKSSGSGSASVMTWVSPDDKSGGHKTIYIQDGDKELKDGEVRYNVEVRTDNSGNKTEKTSYVIAKDGMVVTIEGDSEEKVKEVAAMVESKLGVAKEGKEEVKTETKKTVKK